MMKCGAFRRIEIMKTLNMNHVQYKHKQTATMIYNIDHQSAKNRKFTNFQSSVTTGKPVILFSTSISRAVVINIQAIRIQQPSNINKQHFI